MNREAGYVALEVVLAIGLLLVPVALLVLTLPTWVERTSMARLAAREAARTVVTADEASAAGGAAFAEAGLVVARTAENHGTHAEEISVCFSVHDANVPPPRSCTGPRALTRADAVTAHVSVIVPAAVLPGLPVELPATTRSILHTERVDAYRSW